LINLIVHFNASQLRSAEYVFVYVWIKCAFCATQLLLYYNSTKSAKLSLTCKALSADLFQCSVWSEISWFISSWFSLISIGKYYEYSFTKPLPSVFVMMRFQ